MPFETQEQWRHRFMLETGWMSNRVCNECYHLLAPEDQWKSVIPVDLLQHSVEKKKVEGYMFPQYYNVTMATCPRCGYTWEVRRERQDISVWQRLKKFLFRGEKE